MLRSAWKSLVTLVALVSILVVPARALASTTTFDFSDPSDITTDTATVELGTYGARLYVPADAVVREATTNLLSNPSLAWDADSDGLADGYTYSASGALETAKSVSGGQRIQVLSSTSSGEAYIAQIVPVTVGNPLSVSVRGSLSNPEGIKGFIQVRWRDGSGYLNGGANDPSPSEFTVSGRWLVENLLVPAGATAAEIQAGLKAVTAGASGSGLLTESQAEVLSRSTLFTTGTLPTGPVFGENSASFYETSVMQPTVLKDGSKYRMWFQGARSSTCKIGYAESSDFIHWGVGNGQAGLTFTPSLGIMIGGPSVIKDGDTFKMWLYKTSSGYGVYYATSTNGLDWSVANGGSVVLASVANPTVLKDGSTYRMWFNWPGANATIGYATSADGLTWTVQNGGSPVLSPQASTFYSTSVTAPSVVLTDGVYRMLFIGNNTTLGYATSADGISWSVVGSCMSSVADGVAYLTEHGVAKIIYLSGTDLTYATSSDYVHWVSPLEASAFLGKSLVGSETLRRWNYGVGHPQVFKVGTQYVMFVTGTYYNSPHMYTRLFKLASPNGIDWSRPEMVIGPDGEDYPDGPGSPSVIMTGDKADIWFVTDSTYQNLWRLAPDSDPVQCTLNSDSTFDTVSFPSIIRDGPGFSMWYLHSNTIYWCQSPDGYTWDLDQKAISLAGGNSDITGLRVSKLGDIYDLWFSMSGPGGYRVYHATSEDRLVWELHTRAPALTATAGTFYASSVGAPGVLIEDGLYRLWFCGADSSVTQIGYAELPQTRAGVVGTETPLDTTGWSEITSITPTYDSNDEDIRFLLSPNGFATVMSYKDGQWWGYYEGGWNEIVEDADDLLRMGMKPSELAALGAEEYEEFLAAGDSLSVAVIFNPDTYERPSVQSVTVEYDGSAISATYQVDNAQYSATSWHCIDQTYVALTQPQYAEARFYASTDGGSTLKAYSNGSWSSYTGGTSEQIETSAATLFGTGMTRNELEALTADEFDSLLPASTFDLYAIQRITSQSTSGYAARFYVNYTEKYIYDTRGELYVVLDDGVGYTFDMSAAEMQDFVEWASLCEHGRGPEYYIISMTASSPYTRVTRRIYYSKIVWFEVREYNG